MQETTNHRRSFYRFARAEPTNVDTFSNERIALDRDGTIRGVDMYDTVRSAGSSLSGSSLG